MLEISKYDENFCYRLLGRMQADCLYYLGCGGRSSKTLWSGNVTQHIMDMKELYNSFPDDKKPEWITYEMILEYQKNMEGDLYSESECS